MHIRNKTSRYHLVIETLSILSAKKIVTSAKAEKLAVLFEEKIRKHSDFIREFGDDPDEIKYWRWKGKH